MYSPNLCCYSRSWCWLKEHTVLPNHITIVCVYTVQSEYSGQSGPEVILYIGKVFTGHHVYFHSCSVCFRSGQDVHFRRSFHFPYGNLSSFGHVEDVLPEQRTALPPRATRYGEVLLVGKVRTSGARLVVPSSTRRQKRPILQKGGPTPN